MPRTTTISLSPPVKERLDDVLPPGDTWDERLAVAAEAISDEYEDESPEMELKRVWGELNRLSRQLNNSNGGKSR